MFHIRIVCNLLGDVLCVCILKAVAQCVSYMLFHITLSQSTEKCSNTLRAHIHTCITYIEIRGN